MSWIHESNKFCCVIRSTLSSPKLLVLSFQERSDVGHKNPQFQRRIKLCNFTLCTLLHNTWTQVHFDFGKMAVMVWSGSATHPSN